MNSAAGAKCIVFCFCLFFICLFFFFFFLQKTTIKGVHVTLTKTCRSLDFDGLMNSQFYKYEVVYQQYCYFLLISCHFLKSKMCFSELFYLVDIQNYLLFNQSMQFLFCLQKCLFTNYGFLIGYSNIFNICENPNFTINKSTGDKLSNVS